MLLAVCANTQCLWKVDYQVDHRNRTTITVTFNNPPLSHCYHKHPPVVSFGWRFEVRAAPLTSTWFLFVLDWLVQDTEEHNLVALTCSLKKALSTGIRL